MSLLMEGQELQNIKLPIHNISILNVLKIKMLNGGQTGYNGLASFESSLAQFSQVLCEGFQK